MTSSRGLRERGVFWVTEAIAKGYHAGNAFFVRVNDAFLSQNSIDLVIIEALNRARINANHASCGHHIAKSDVGLLCCSIKQGS